MKTIIELIHESGNSMFTGNNKYNPDRALDKDGNPRFWYQCYLYLLDNGPTSKKDLLVALGKKPTSYASMFAELNTRDIIKSKNGKLEAIPQKDWHRERKAWHETHYDQSRDGNFEYDPKLKCMVPVD